MKTYLPKLLKLLLLLCHYMLRYEIQIKSFLGGAHDVAVDNALAACQILAVIVEDEMPPPS